MPRAASPDALDARRVMLCSIHAGVGVDNLNGEQQVKGDESWCCYANLYGISFQACSEGEITILQRRRAPSSDAERLSGHKHTVASRFHGSGRILSQIVRICRRRFMSAGSAHAGKRQWRTPCMLIQMPTQTLLHNLNSDLEASTSSASSDPDSRFGSFPAREHQ
jgi:hypothetical protein